MRGATYTPGARYVAKKHDAGQKISLELIEGRELVERYAKAAEGERWPRC
ncbi:MAG: hypothetical protein R3D30_11600 [Hyphomicrobiales bacterium]